MKTWTFIFAIFICFQSIASDLPEELFIDEYNEQDTSYGETYARLTYVGKFATLFREGQIEESAVRNLPVVSGDRIETGYSSYAELEFIDGSLLQIAERAELEMQAINEVYSDESLTVIRLLEGQVFLHVAENPEFNQDQVFRIDSRAGSAYIEAPGIYMLSFDSGRMKLKTYRGLAELSGEYGSVLVHSGEFSSIRGMGRPVSVVAFNSFGGNDFERWAYDRRPILKSASARYVQGPIASYSRDLDDHGEWRYNSTYETHVWVPYARNEWRPYYNGYWSPIGGRLTWVSHDPFGYVTHHYGRWGWSLDFGWYWIPSVYYSPGWVAWTTYDSYIGWCPLGYWNRPYYYKRNQYNTVVINNHHNRWNYITLTDVTTRRAVRISHREPPRNQARRITTRPIAVGSDDIRDGRRVARIIREPEINRERYTEVRQSRGQLVSPERSGRSERTAIVRRDTGTQATSRYAQTTREVRQQRVKPEGSSLVERSVPRASDSSNRSAERSGRNQDNQPSRAIPRQDRPTQSSTERTNRTRTAPTTSQDQRPSSERAAQPSRQPETVRPGTSRTSPPKRETKPEKEQRSVPPQRQPRQTTKPQPSSQRQATTPPSSSRQAQPRATPPPQRQQASPPPRQQVPRTSQPRSSASGQSSSQRQKPTATRQSQQTPPKQREKPPKKEKDN